MLAKHITIPIIIAIIILIAMIAIPTILVIRHRKSRNVASAPDTPPRTFLQIHLEGLRKWEKPSPRPNRRPSNATTGGLSLPIRPAPTHQPKRAYTN